jgi:hypothetical protein
MVSAGSLASQAPILVTVPPSAPRGGLGLAASRPGTIITRRRGPRPGLLLLVLRQLLLLLVIVVGVIAGFDLAPGELEEPVRWGKGSAARLFQARD